MTTYPNREHQVADQAARRRALKALSDINDEAGIMVRRLDNGDVLDGSSTHTMSVSVRALTEYLTQLETLRDVREWAKADKADERTFRCHGCNRTLVGNEEADAHKLVHGLVTQEVPDGGGN